MMGTREKLKGGGEYDALTRAKRFYGWRPMARKYAKARFWRRVRSGVRRLIKGESHDPR